MTKIQRVSRILQVIFILGLIALPIIESLYWIYYPLLCQGGTFCIGYMPLDLPISSGITAAMKWQAWLVNAIPMLIKMFIFYCLIRLFRLYEHEKIFTADNVRYIRYIGMAFIINELINPFIQAFTSLIMTAHNAPGKHIISISLTNYNFSNILIGVIILLISWVMAEACKIHEEQSYTV